MSSQDSTESEASGSKPRFKLKPNMSSTFLPASTRSLQSPKPASPPAFHSKRKPRRQSPRQLPPLGIFWDIENCQVPRQRSASAVVQRIREFFLEDHREAEFLVVCDVKRERAQVVQELHDAQVNLIHVASTSKNAADEKLRQSLRRFAEVYAAPACVVLISGDVNFAADLSDLRYRKKMRVVLLHNANAADALILCANQHFCYAEITEGLPQERVKAGEELAYLVVSNLPTSVSTWVVKQRLNLLTSNCGGRCFDVNLTDGSACLRFSSQDFANRAQKRIQGEDVFGNKIKVVQPSVKNFTGRKMKGNEAGLQNHGRNSIQHQDSFSANDLKRYPYELIAQEFNSRTSDYHNSFSSRRARTPQEPLQSIPNRVYRTSGSSEMSDDTNNTSSAKYDPKLNQPVDLIISNLDTTFGIMELRGILANMLKEFTMILNLNVVTQADGTPIANIKVGNQQAAQCVISQLHRHRLGHKRIIISYAQQNTSPDLDQLRAMVISILQEVPDNRMPLFKFIELLESRYHCTFSVCDVNKLKDICKCTDHMGSRMISILQEVKAAPLPSLNKTLLPYCTIHCPNGLPNLGWCELNTTETPNVMMPLQEFSTKLNNLLNLHMGSMPLLSFQACYEQVCNEPLTNAPNGVPLEHLLSCVPNIEITCSSPNKNIKLIRREVKPIESDAEENVFKAVPPVLAPNVSLLCREVVDLLKTTDRCQLFLNKFIPAYHHHFGRQCHVADYGYTKLIDLLESISHVVQIMNDGSRKIITLSHQAQMRRFTSDLLRVLKLQPAKQISINEFSSAYEKVLDKQFNPVDYGLCTFQDLLCKIPDNIIVIIQNEDDVLISVPKREQTAKEIMRTKQFASEVIDILQHSPNCTMLFHKFVPAYHHHFGHQCRVADYGFTKLIELFEAIPDFVKINELPNGERTVGLTVGQSLKILGGQIMGLIKNLPNSLPLDDLPKIYLKEYGYLLRPQFYECDTLHDLMDRLDEHVQVLQDNSGPILCCVDAEMISMLKTRAWSILVQPPHCKQINKFQFEYQLLYNTEITINTIKQLRNIISLSHLNNTNYIVLTDLYILAAELYHLLYANGGSILFSNIEQLYYQAFRKELKLSEYNITSLEDLYEKFDFLFYICAYKKKVLALNRNLAEHQIPLPPQIFYNNFPVKKWQPDFEPIHQLVRQSLKKISPPKPDTPPTTPTTSPWSYKTSDNMSLSIPLPIDLNPMLVGNPYDLISPSHHLFGRRSWSKAPDPIELPMPDRLIGKGGHSSADESHDSGVASKIDLSPNGEEPGACGVGAKRRLHLLNFDN